MTYWRILGFTQNSPLYSLCESVRPGNFEVCFKQIEAVEKIDLDEKLIDPK